MNTYHVVLTDNENLLCRQSYVSCFYNPEMPPYVDPQHWAHSDVACYLVYNIVNTVDITALMLLGKVIGIEEQYINHMLTLD